MHELLFGVAILVVLLFIWSRTKSAQAPQPIPVVVTQPAAPPAVESFSPADAWRVASTQAPTFSNTLQRRFGMGSAGGSGKEPFGSQSCVGTFDCMKENYRSSGDIAANTMMAGFQGASTLPL